MDITRAQFHEYCGSNLNFADLAGAGLNLTAAATPVQGTGDWNFDSVVVE
jgi:hypothetical protein